MRVTRVLNLVEDEEYRPGERELIEQAFAEAGIEEHRMRLTDFGQLPADELEAAVTTVNAWLEEGMRVYLHCRAGWQRSAAVAAGVVALREQLDIGPALERVQSRKPSADPLPHQREDLVRWWEERSA
jgi:protein-tyrosine phosphatase